MGRQVDRDRPRKLGGASRHIDVFTLLRQRTALRTVLGLLHSTSCSTSLCWLLYAGDVNSITTNC